jgi:methyl-accepting chemotaxis protein
LSNNPNQNNNTPAKDKTMLKNLKLRTSILIGYAIPILLFIAATLLVFGNLTKLGNATNDAFISRDISQNVLILENSASEIIRGVRGYILTQRENNKKTVINGDEDFLSTLELLKILVSDPEQKERLKQLTQLQQEFMNIALKEIELVEQGNTQAAIDMVSGELSNKTWKNFKLVMQDFSARQKEILDKRLNEQQSLMQNVAQITWIATISAAIIALISGVFIAARINNVLHESINTLASSSTEISATVEEHERTVLQQTASVSQTTSTTEQLRVSAQTSADQAENAASVVKKALQLAEDGSASSERSTSGMGDLQDKVKAIAVQILQLSEQAGQIGVIAKVVGDLASETNMLALNAAVEAARAGENGKGFAVVASEVRKLADQSKKSAERANALVDDIQKATNSAVMVAEEGSKTAAEVFNISVKNGETFHSLTDYAEMIDRNAQQIVLNSRQQAGGLGQISEAMHSLNAGATEMAAGTKQTKVGLQNLTEVAARLKAMI